MIPPSIGYADREPNDDIKTQQKQSYQTQHRHELARLPIWVRGRHQRRYSSVRSRQKQTKTDKNVSFLHQWERGRNIIIYSTARQPATVKTHRKSCTASRITAPKRRGQKIFDDIPDGDFSPSQSSSLTGRKSEGGNHEHI